MAQPKHNIQASEEFLDLDIWSQENNPVVREFLEHFAYILAEVSVERMKEEASKTNQQ